MFEIDGVLYMSITCEFAKRQYATLKFKIVTNMNGPFSCREFSVKQLFFLHSPACLH